MAVTTAGLSEAARGGGRKVAANGGAIMSTPRILRGSKSKMDPGIEGGVPILEREDHYTVGGAPKGSTRELRRRGK
jgi:hypothetical protein